MKTRTAILSISAILISGWIPIPIPTGILNKIAPNGLSLHADSIYLNWAPGTLEFHGFKITEAEHQDSELLNLEETQLHLEFFPGRNFLKPRGLYLNNGEVNIEALSSWLKEQNEAEQITGPGKPPPSFKLELHQLRCSAPVGGTTTSFTIEKAHGQATGRKFNLQGNLISDVGLSAQAWLNFDLPSWEFDLLCPESELNGFDFIPAELSAQSCNLQLHLSPSEKSIHFNLNDVSLNVPQPPLQFVLENMKIAGSLQRGIFLDASGKFEGTPMRANGWLSRNSTGSLQARVDGNTAAFVIDKTRTDWIKQLDRGTADVFEALEIRGAMPAQFSWDWTAGKGAGNWLAQSNFQNASLTYRGFLETDGDQPSFPYPLESMSGDFAVIDKQFLFQVAGNMGEGIASGGGRVQLTDGPALLDIELDVNGLPIDHRIRTALTGTPQAGAVWRDLGGPSGGTANLGLRLQRLAKDPKVRLQLEGTVSGTVAKPSFLPIPITAKSVNLNWRPGHASFSGDVHGIGGDLNLIGEVQGVANGELPSIHLVAKTSGGLQPNNSERKILEGFLSLPEGSSNFSSSGDANWQFAIRRSGTSGNTSLLVNTNSNQMDVVWIPVAMEWNNIHGDATIAHVNQRSIISAPRLSAQACSGEILASLHLDTAANPESSSAVVQAINFGIQPESVNFAKAIANLAPNTEDNLNWSGNLELQAELAPLAPEKNRGQIQLIPLNIKNAAMLPSQQVAVTGDLELRNGGFFNGQLELKAESGVIRANKVSIHPASKDATPSISAVLNSELGIEINDRFSQLLSPEAWAAFEKIGLSGNIGARELSVSVFSGEQAGFLLDGNILLRDVALLAAPGMENGAAELVANNFKWSGPSGFGGLLQLRNGAGELAGLQLSDAIGDIYFDPNEILVTDFDAAFLGGRLSTNALELQGHNPNLLPQPKPTQAPSGQLRLSLQENAPLDFKVYLRDADLAVVRENLGLGGNLAGKVDCDFRVSATSPSPLDYSGKIDLRIKNGALGTVPVLSEMWKVAGVQAPIFDSGNFLIEANPKSHRGRLQIEEFTLKHELLQVTGKGWIGLDSYLNLKATVRSALVPVLGWGIPIISDLLFDPLFEQDVMGPITKPKVVQRVLNQLADGDEEHIPFPLWVPGVNRVDWRKSPAFPPSNTID